MAKKKKKRKLVDGYQADPEFFRDPRIGKTIGKCKIVKLLGEGRTAVVYRANYEPLKRTVALKVLSKEMRKFPAVVRVFQQEGRAVAALDHENVVKIYDVGEDQGEYYLVLELLKGKDLRKIIDAQGDEGLDIATALDYTRQAAAGLAAASRKKLVHRDIKPQNLVIEPDGTLKIVDFGLAAEAEGAFAGGRLGTPHYMPPEVCRGEQAQTASDVYSLGITLYHMLIGHAPYAGRKTTDEILEDHLKGERLQPERERPDLPKPVCDLVRRMTRKDADARPTAAEVAKLIGERLTPERLGTRATKRTPRGSRARRKESSAGVYVGIGAVVIIGLLALFMLNKNSGSDGEQEDTQAVAPPPAPTPDATPKPAPTKTKRDPAARENKRDLRSLLKEAQDQEEQGNLGEAHRLYIQVMTNATAEPKIAAEAKSAAEMVKARIEELAGKTQSTSRKPYLSARASKAAGEEFESRHQEFLEDLALFQVSKVRAAIDDYRKRTREDTDERRAIEAASRRLGYLESLVSVLESRGGALSGDDANWFTYDMNTEDDLMIMAVNEKGVSLKDMALDKTTTRPWSAVPLESRVALLEAIRNASNATETLWVAYYCKLAGSGAATRYFDLVTMIDKSLETAKLVKELQGDQ